VLKQLDVLIGFVVVMAIVSLLVMIITQVISSLFGLRGKNLLAALRAMMRGIDPNLPTGTARQLAGYILTRPVISDSMLSMATKFWDKVPILAWFRQRFKKASAIRADELLELIKRIATRGGAGNSGASQSLQNTATALLKNLNDADPHTANAIAAFEAQFSVLAQKEVSQAKALIQQAAMTTDVAMINLERWFNSAQDRAQQWFAIHTRIISVIAAIIAAFILQLDSIDLLKRISADSDLRDKLVAASPAVQSLATNALGEQRDRVDKSTHKAAIASLAKKYPQLPAVLGDHEDFSSIKSAKDWLGEQLKNDSKLDSIVADYSQLVTAMKLQASLDIMTKVAGASPLQLLPTPYPITLNHDWPGHGYFGWLNVFKFRDQWSWPPHRLFGILVSAALLSLGAPFWFNTLKSLTNLRPKLADEIDKDPRQIPQNTSSK
jgi:hypothetical protein